MEIKPEQCENTKVIIESTFSNNTSKVERIRELFKANKDGRLVLLPRKGDDTVYFRTYDCNGMVDLVGCAMYTDVKLLPDQYGIGWFLTREEVERELKAMKDD